MKEGDLLFLKILLHNKLITNPQAQQCIQLYNEYTKAGQYKEMKSICVEKGLVSATQAQKVVDAQAKTMQMQEDKLYGQLAVKNGFITQAKLNEVSNLQKNQKFSDRLGDLLIKQGLLNDKQHRALLNAVKRVMKAKGAKGKGADTDVIGDAGAAGILPPASGSPSASPSAPAAAAAPSQNNWSAPGASSNAPSYDESFVQMAMQRGLLSQAQVDECRNIGSKMREMGIDKSLDQIIIEKKYIDKDNLKTLVEALPVKSPIESYICDKKLGEGAMGMVYKAKLKGTSETVALKVLNPGQSEDSEFLRRFIREAQAAIELDHPNIVRAYEVGVSDDFYYYSMEYVEGFSVKELLDEGAGAIKEEKALEYAIHIASALEFAAERHIVHRDIKPENIMIDTKKSKMAKLCDLGIAKRLDSDLSLTKPGMAVGTPYFISPEQARGGQVDARSDIYSLGATLFNMATGEVPYDGENATQILIAHVTGEIPHASQRNPEVSQTFSEIIYKMMQKKPEDRYQSCTDLLVDLRALAGGGGGGGGGGSATKSQSGMQSPIESYVVHKVLGQGAMGIVYLASIEGQEQLLALKVLLPQVAEDKEFLKRFILEAQASIEFEHEKIVKAYEVGISGDYYYYSMEYVEGKSIKSVMEDHGGALPEKLALTMTLDIVEALCYAHVKQVVHRDIKPENLMYTNEGVAKLCDLGIAKQLSNDKGLTQPGMAVGSPYYIAPEQARGAKVDCRTDMYALGASMFHMLTGEVPFEGYTAAAVMAKHVRDPVPDPRERKPDLNPAIAQLIMKMMQKKPEDRYPDPNAVQTELEKILSTYG